MAGVTQVMAVSLGVISNISYHILCFRPLYLDHGVRTSVT